MTTAPKNQTACAQCAESRPLMPVKFDNGRTYNICAECVPKVAPRRGGAFGTQTASIDAAVRHAPRDFIDRHRIPAETNISGSSRLPDADEQVRFNPPRLQLKTRDTTPTFAEELEEIKRRRSGGRR